MRPLRILLVASEVTPFAKTGGLADVSAGLAGYLARAGHDVRLFMPLYERVRVPGRTFDPHPALQELEVRLGQDAFYCSVSASRLPDSDLDVWFLDCPELYARDEIYSSANDEHLRFGLLSLAPLEVCQRLQWAPDVIHCNDWHTGLLPLYLKAGYSWDRLFESTRTVLTIHNIGYQGSFSAEVVGDLSLEDHRGLLHQDALSQGRVSFLQTGILYADVLTTVSETYAREIQTAEFGMGLEELLRARADSLVGIVNGVDYGEWDPRTDPYLARKYSADDLPGKLENKRALLSSFELSLSMEAPVFGIVSRLTAQKGFELLPAVLPVLLREGDARLVVLGSGEETHERYFQGLRDRFPSQVAFFAGYYEELAHRIEAGADLFLMPSRYEPCGLNQMYSLRYGTVPIVRRTGGLADTVQPYDPRTGTGTGFLFEEFSSEALFVAIREALACFRRPRDWERLVRNGMACDYSWERQGSRYVDLYARLANL